MASFSLNWPLDQAGYRIEDRPAGSGRTALESFPAYKVIVRNGGSFDYDDQLIFGGLYRRLAACKTTPEGALSFVSRYGFLTTTDDEERVDFICHEIRAVRHAIALIKRGNWDAVARWVDANANVFRLRLTLDQTSDGRLRLFFGLRSLRDAIYFQLLADTADGAKLMKCDRPGCPEWFKVGPGTGHRERAVGKPAYCSPKCQMADAYRKRKETKR